MIGTSVERMMRIATVSVLAAITLAALAPQSSAQGLESGKICQVIRSCNFARTASVRGCLSSYSCRECQLVKKGFVTIDGVRRTEWRSVCDWGAGS
jgi:hypothetical protein